MKSFTPVLALKSLEPVFASARNRPPGFVRSLTPEGPMLRIEIDCGFALTALLINPPRCEELALQENDRVVAMVKATNVHLIPRFT
jgi:molybdopterin-binding protein